MKPFLDRRRATAATTDNDLLPLTGAAQRWEGVSDDVLAACPGWVPASGPCDRSVLQAVPL